MFSFNTNKTSAASKPSSNSLFGSLSVAATKASTTSTVSSSGSSLFGAGASTTTVTSIAPPLSIPTKVAAPQDSRVDVKEDTVPVEIIKDVNSFKEFMKKEKEESNQISRFNTKSLNRITSEVKNLSSTLASLSSCYKTNIFVVKKLKNDLTNELQHAENTHITQNMSPTMQLDNILPVKYFQKMLKNFELNMISYQQQINDLEQHISVMNNPTTLTAQDISLALTKMHENFIALASNLHSIHGNISRLKEQYLVYRRLVYGDTYDIFAEKAAEVSNETNSSTSNKLSNAVALAMTSILQPSVCNQANAQTVAQQTSTFGSNAFGASNNATSGSLFGSKPAASGGLFGNSTGGLFGSKPATNTSFGSTSAKPSLFGNASTSKTSMFGSSSGNLFGGKLTSATTSSAFTFGGKPAATKTFSS